MPAAEREAHLAARRAAGPAPRPRPRTSAGPRTSRPGARSPPRPRRPAGRRRPSRQQRVHDARRAAPRSRRRPRWRGASVRSPASTRFSSAVRGPGSSRRTPRQRAELREGVLVDADRLRQARPVVAGRPAAHELARRLDEPVRAGALRSSRASPAGCAAPPARPGRVMLVVWHRRSTRGAPAGSRSAFSRITRPR